MCKKQTSVSHSSTEAEIISLDAGLRMDGIPAESEIISLDAGLRMDGIPALDVVIELLHSSKNTHTHSHQAVEDCCRKSETDKQVQGDQVRGEIQSTNRQIIF